MTGWDIRPGRRGLRVARLSVLAAVFVSVAACSAVDPAGSAEPSGRASAAPSHDPGAPPVTVTVAQLLADPEPLLGRSVEVVGRVFFLSRCPPPGSSTTGCELAGYLAEADRGSFVASDVDQGIALAEGGSLLSCAEGTNPTPTCGDWQAATVYTVSGSLARQVLGGRETPYLQLDVEGKVVAS
jgi:hypothetical protein